MIEYKEIEEEMKKLEKKFDEIHDIMIEYMSQIPENEDDEKTREIQGEKFDLELDIIANQYEKLYKKQIKNTMSEIKKIILTPCLIVFFIIVIYKIIV